MPNPSPLGLAMPHAMATDHPPPSRPPEPASRLTLDALWVGQSGSICHIDVDSAGPRLMEMGLVPGTLVRVVRLAPLGDPMDVAVRGYHLSLRKSEARSVFIDPGSLQDAPR